MRVLRGSGDSLNMKAAYMEVFSDMLGSLGVIAAALIIKFTGWWQVDPILAVLIGLWVLPRSWKLLSESVNILLEGVPAELEMQKLLDELKALPGVVDVHDMHVWAITSGKNSLTVHLKVSAYPTDYTLMQQAQAIVKKHGIDHANFQLETDANSNHPQTH
jgi:cobalt-zinc-cadmium efflux system protein